MTNWPKPVHLASQAVQKRKQRNTKSSFGKKEMQTKRLPACTWKHLCRLAFKYSATGHSFILILLLIEIFIHIDTFASRNFHSYWSFRKLRFSFILILLQVEIFKRVIKAFVIFFKIWHLSCDLAVLLHISNGQKLLIKMTAWYTRSWKMALIYARKGQEAMLDGGSHRWVPLRRQQHNSGQDS